jgi:hypothetical protein
MLKEGRRVLLFRIDPGDSPSERRIRLFVDGAVEPAAEDVAKLAFEGSTRAALAALADGDATEAQILVGGNALWERLRTGAIGAALEPLRDADRKLHIELALQPADEALPWEAMVDENRKRLAASHDYLLARHPDRKLRPAPPRSGPLSMLTVVPERTRLQVDGELVAIRRAFEDRGVALHSGDPMHGRVTVDTLREQLERKVADDGAPYEILHFIGHGLVGTDGVPKLQLNDDESGEHEISPSSLASLLEGMAPRLVVLNACHAGSAAEVKGLAGFGQELLGAGVQAVVAMQRAIRNDLAIDFAIAFYGELAQSGRVDAAVTAGRRRLHQKQKADTATAFAIPVLFEMSGVEPLFAIAPRQDDAAPEAGDAARRRPRPPTPPLRVDVPAALIKAVSQGWCIPVLGPSLNTPSRDGGPAWTPSTLAEMLARKCQFPGHTVIAALSQLGECLDHMVLQRVCEHFEKQSERLPLNDEVREFMTAGQTIPKIHHHLASWPVPGFVCSHFDGFLARAFELRGRPFRAINSPDEHAPPAEAGAPLIVHLRGSVRDEHSLRLTGSDHDRLLDAMTRMDARSSGVSGLVAARNGTCLLLLGTTAWDPWLRHLLWRIVPRDSYERNPLYIVQPHPTEADRAAWGGFSVRWIEEAPEDVVAAITEQLAGPEARR